MKISGLRVKMDIILGENYGVRMEQPGTCHSLPARSIGEKSNLKWSTAVPFEE